MGEFLNLIAGYELFPVKRLFRGGSIDSIRSGVEIGQARSVFNLRNREDFHRFEFDSYHFPMDNKVEKYNTSNREVRSWLNSILFEFENENLRYPVLIHCLSGKDRTGIVTAALLLVCGISKELIVEEYLLSDGEVNTELIEHALSGMKDINAYFNRIDLEKVRINVLGK